MPRRFTFGFLGEKESGKGFFILNDEKGRRIRVLHLPKGIR
jgi:hypothetical protein